VPGTTKVGPLSTVSPCVLKKVPPSEMREERNSSVTCPSTVSSGSTCQVAASWPIGSAVSLADAPGLRSPFWPSLGAIEYDRLLPLAIRNSPGSQASRPSLTFSSVGPSVALPQAKASRNSALGPW
jgi:hypothetical protein